MKLTTDTDAFHIDTNNTIRMHNEQIAAQLTNACMLASGIKDEELDPIEVYDQLLVKLNKGEI